MVSAKMLTRLQRIHRTAVRALALPGAGHVQKNSGVAAVNFHVRFGAGAVHTALGVQVRREQFDV